MKLFLPLLTLSLLTASCEKEVDLKIPEQESRLTLHSLTYAGDTITVSVGRSRSILAQRVDSLLFVKNATVVLKADNAPADTLHYDPERQIYVSRTLATPGQRYQLRVSLAGFKPVEATAEAPARVGIQTVERLQNVRTSTNGMLDELRITFTDPTAPGNFYAFDLIGIYPDPSDPDASIVQSLQACVQTSDADVETLYGTEPGSTGVGSSECTNLGALFLRDSRFNGSIKELRLFVPHFVLESAGDSLGNVLPVILQLAHRGEDYMRYLRSRESYYNSNGNPFAEPVNVVGNVQGGYGIFAIESMNEREIQ